MSEDKVKLLCGLPLEFEGRYIAQPKISDIVAMGVEEYYKKCFPFLISLEFLDIESDKNKDFDLFWLINEKILGDKYLIESLAEGLVFFFRTENIDFDYNSKEIVIYDKKIEEKIEEINGEMIKSESVIKFNKATINRDNFDVLAQKIMLITNTEKLKNEKKDLSKLSDKARRFLEAKERYEKATKKDDDLINNLYNLINYLVHFSNSLDYKGIIDLTMYQANNSMVVYSKKDTYKVNLSAYFAGAKINKKDLKHWSS